MTFKPRLRRSHFSPHLPPYLWQQLRKFRASLLPLPAHLSLRALPNLAGSPQPRGAGNTVNAITLQLSSAPDLLGNRAALRRAEKASHFSGTHGFVLPLPAKTASRATCPERRQERIQTLNVWGPARSGSLFGAKYPKYPSSWMQLLYCSVT